MPRTRPRLAFVAVAVLAVTACSGGSGSANRRGSSTTSINLKPGATATVNCPSALTFTVANGGKTVRLACPATTTTTTIPTTTTIAPTTSTTVAPTTTTVPLITPPSSIAADCSVEVSAQLQAWITSEPNGTTAAPTVISLAGGCYRIDGPFAISGKSNFTIDGAGATLRRMADPGAGGGCCGNGYPHVALGSDTNLTIENLHIQGLNTVSDVTSGACDPSGFGSGYSITNVAEAGILANLDTNLIFSNVSINGVFGDGITIGGEHPADSQVNSATLTNVTVDKNGRQGITIDDASNVLLDHVQVLHSHASGIDIEPNGGDGGTLGVEVRSSTINSRFVAISGQGSDPVSSINVHDNTIVCSLASYPWIVDGNGAALRHDWTVARNVLEAGLDSPTMGLSNTTNVTVTGNTSPVNYNPNVFVSKYPGVVLNSDSGTVTVSNNSFPGASCGPATGVYPCAPPTVTPVLSAPGTVITVDCGNTVGDPAALLTNQPMAC